MKLCVIQINGAQSFRGFFLLFSYLFHLSRGSSRYIHIMLLLIRNDDLCVRFESNK